MRLQISAGTSVYFYSPSWYPVYCRSCLSLRESHYQLRTPGLYWAVGFEGMSWFRPAVSAVVYVNHGTD